MPSPRVRTPRLEARPKAVIVNGKEIYMPDLRRDYVLHKVSTANLALKYGISATYVLTLLRWYRIPIRARGSYQTSKLREVKLEDIKNLTLNEIASKYSVHRTTAYRLRRRLREKKETPQKKHRRIKL